MITQICGALISAVIALIIWFDRMTVPLALMLAPVFGSVVAFAQPVRSSVVPSLVPRVLLMRAIVIMTIGANVGMIIGPVLAGVLIDTTGIAVAFGAQSVFFAAGALVLIPLRIPPLAARAAASMRADMAEGLAYVWRDRQLRALFALLAVGGAFMTGGSFVLIPRMARNEFERSAGQASFLFAVLGAGLLTTSWLLMWKRRFPRRGLVFMLSMVVGTSNMMLQGFAPTYMAFAVMLFLWGCTGGLYINLNLALIQEHAPADKMGRVMSLHSMISMGLAPMGALAAGLLATVIGDRATLNLLGAIGLSAVLTALVAAKALRAMD
jgi:MFS family permease